MPDMFSGDCLTPYSTAAKTVDIDNYTLTTGVLLAVKFLAGKEGTVPANSTLNVSNTGAVPIVLETDEIEFIPGGNMLYLFTYDGEGYNIIGYNSEDNPDGVSKWYAGTHITGTSTTETVFPQSEVDNAVVGDMYLNTSTNNVYQCTFAGVPAIAKWKYIANIEGAPGFSPRATVTKSGSTATITITDEEGTTSETVSDGEDGQDGQDGQDGYSPTATVTKSGDTATITITDVNGTTSETVSDGTDGQDGQDGQDGYSPTATVSKSGDTATITITDKNGTTTETVSDGTDGQDGQDGQDGYSPTATVSKSGDTATITITDKNGTTTETVSDGTDGQDGQDGYSPTATVSKSGDTATITITDKNGTTTQMVSDGADGQPGADGDDGATIWTATANATTPNYTFNISDLVGQTGRTPQVGDLVVRSYYRYTISSVGSTTVLTDNRTSIRGSDGANGQMLYATCSTGSSTAAKVATLSAGTLTLSTGATVAVTFANDNTAENPTLNVSSTGAKPIIAIGENLTGTSAYNWVEYATVIFVYDGTNWQMDGTSGLYRADNAKTIADDATASVNSIDLLINGGYDIEVSSSYTDQQTQENISVDKVAFYNAVEGELDTYNFTYSGSSWTFGGSNIDLQDYGITLDSIVPSSGDVITIDLYDVEGSIKNLTDSFVDLSNTVQTNTNDLQDDINSLSDTLDQTTNYIINDQINGAINQSIQNLIDITSHYEFSTTTGFVLYGSGNKDGFVLQLTSNTIAFINGAVTSDPSTNPNVLAYISGNMLNINNASINNQLKFGNFAFIPRTNGNMCLKYLG